MVLKKRFFIPTLVASLLVAGCHDDPQPGASAVDSAAQASSPTAPAVAQTVQPSAPLATPADTQQVAPNSASGLIRVHYGDLFADNGDGSFTPKVSITFSGITMGAGGIRFTRGNFFAGLDLAALAGHDFNVRQLPTGAYELVQWFN